MQEDDIIALIVKVIRTSSRLSDFFEDVKEIRIALVTIAICVFVVSSYHFIKILVYVFN